MKTKEELTEMTKVELINEYIKQQQVLEDFGIGDYQTGKSKDTEMARLYADEFERIMDSLELKWYHQIDFDLVHNEYKDMLEETGIFEHCKAYGNLSELSDEVLLNRILGYAGRKLSGDTFTIKFRNQIFTKTIDESY